MAAGFLIECCCAMHCSVYVLHAMYCSASLWLGVWALRQIISSQFITLLQVFNVNCALCDCMSTCQTATKHGNRRATAVVSKALYVLFPLLVCSAQHSSLLHIHVTGKTDHHMDVHAACAGRCCSQGTPAEHFRRPVQLAAA